MPSTSANFPIPRMRRVQCASAVGLHDVAYTEWGDPDNPRVLVCVHGLTRSGRDFDRLAAALSMSIVSSARTSPVAASQTGSPIRVFTAFRNMSRTW